MCNLALGLVALTISQNILIKLTVISHSISLHMTFVNPVDSYFFGPMTVKVVAIFYKTEIRKSHTSRMERG